MSRQPATGARRCPNVSQLRAASQSRWPPSTPAALPGGHCAFHRRERMQTQFVAVSSVSPSRNMKAQSGDGRSAFCLAAGSSVSSSASRGRVLAMGMPARESSRGERVDAWARGGWPMLSWRWRQTTRTAGDHHGRSSAAVRFHEVPSRDLINPQGIRPAVVRVHHPPPPWRQSWASRRSTNPRCRNRASARDADANALA